MAGPAAKLNTRSGSWIWGGIGETGAVDVAAHLIEMSLFWVAKLEKLLVVVVVEELGLRRWWRLGFWRRREFGDEVSFVAMVVEIWEKQSKTEKNKSKLF